MRVSPSRLPSAGPRPGRRWARLVASPCPGQPHRHPCRCRRSAPSRAELISLIRPAKRRHMDRSRQPGRSLMTGLGLGCVKTEKVKQRLESSSPISAMSRRKRSVSACPALLQSNSFQRSFCWMRFYTARVTTSRSKPPYERSALRPEADTLNQTVRSRCTPPERDSFKPDPLRASVNGGETPSAAHCRATLSYSRTKVGSLSAFRWWPSRTCGVALMPAVTPAGSDRRGVTSSGPRPWADRDTRSDRAAVAAARSGTAPDA